MSRSCTVCAHVNRDKIDEVLLAGQSLRDIAGQFLLSKSALERHKVDHLPATLVKAQEVAEIVRADNLLDKAQGLYSKAQSILSAAEEAGDLRTALIGVREARGNLELLSKLLVHLAEQPKVGNL